MSRGKIVIYSERRSSASMVAAIVAEAAQVIYCSAVEQTVAACRNEHPEVVILLDIKTFIDGSELIARIRRKGERRPLIYVVAWQQSEQIVLSLLECGADQYLTFPICMSRLKSKAEAGVKSLL